MHWNFNNFVSAILCQQYASLCTEEELEFAVLAHKSKDLGIHKPMFLSTTDVNLLPWQHLHHISFSVIQGSQIPSGNSDIGLGLLHPLLGLINILGFLGFGRGWHDSPQRPDPTSRAQEETKPEMQPAFHLRQLLAPPITCSIFDISISVGAMVLIERLPCLASNLSLRCRGNLIFLLGHQTLVSYVAAQQWRFEIEAFLLIDRLPLWWGCCPGVMSPICPPCGKVLFDRIVHGEFVSVPVQVHT